MPLHLYHGAEAFLVERAFQKAWSDLTKDLTSDLDAEMLDAAASPGEVLTAASAVGFFSPSRVVGIRDWKPLVDKPGRRGRAKAAEVDPAQAAADALAQLPETSNVVLAVGNSVPPTHPVLMLARANGTAMEFQKLRYRDLDDWVARRVRELGAKAEPKAMRLLIDSAGDDLRLLDAELQKLQLYAGDATITVKDVLELVPDTAEHQVWDLTDALVVDPGKAAMELDRALAAGEPAGRLSYMLVRHLRLLLAAADAGKGDAAVRQLTQAFSGDGRPLSEYSVKKTLEQARRVDRARVEAIYRRAAAAEAAQRRGELEEDTALRLVVMEAALGEPRA